MDLLFQIWLLVASTELLVFLIAWFLKIFGMYERPRWNGRPLKRTVVAVGIILAILLWPITLMFLISKFFAKLPSRVLNGFRDLGGYLKSGIYDDSSSRRS